MKKIAVVTAKGLGDGLLYLILSHNLESVSDNEVVTFNSNLPPLQRWFPGKSLHTYPTEWEEALAPFDQIIASDHSPLATFQDKRILLLGDHLFSRKKSLVENLTRVSQELLGVKSATSYNGIRIPAELTFKKFPHRVVIHPMSAELKRMWKKEKFLLLADRLKKEGLDPSLCLANFERELWSEEIGRQQCLFPLFNDLDAMASFLVESGYMIGNNSGIGHLASNLNIPTLSLFARKGYSKLWRPGWGQGRVITPPLLIGSKLKERYWKEFLSVSRVHHAFRQLQKREK